VSPEPAATHAPPPGGTQSPAAAGHTPASTAALVPEVPSPAAPRNVSLTISPLHVLLPMLELQAEVRLGAAFGVAVFGGIGRTTLDGGPFDDEELTVYELGANATLYPIETFESLQLAAELKWVKVGSDELGSEDIDAVATGLAVGPLLGYKLITDAGFTFLVQGGVAYVVMEGESESDDSFDEESDETWVPLLNLKLGWSF
jgi:hypothetical protein